MNTELPLGRLVRRLLLVVVAM
ncbi:MAG TPA: cytochrome c oxidase assembly protein, partial [Pseudomonas sp.]|nr:cytochrome c oxidase assembly protein [Pseudomonas sp.]